MKVERYDAKGIEVHKFSGQVRISTQNDFKDILDGIVKNNKGGTVLLNMEGITYMNSTGLGILADSCLKLRRSGGNMVLCSLVPDMRNLFQAARMYGNLEIHKTENEALKIINTGMPDVSGISGNSSHVDFIA